MIRAGLFTLFIAVILSVNVLAGYTGITITATDIDQDRLVEKIKLEALEKFTLTYMSGSSDYQKKLAMQYYMIYSPLGYVKDIQFIEIKHFTDYIKATATVYISEGQVMSTMEELIGDFGNPKVYIEMNPEISVKNITQPGSITEYEMMFPLRNVFEPLIFKKLKDTGFEIVSEKQKSQFQLIVNPVADIYRSENFTLTLNCHIKAIDTKTSEIISNLQGTVGPRSFVANPSFMLDIMADRLLDKVLENLSVEILRYVFNAYNKQITINLFDFKMVQIKDFTNYIVESLPTIIKGPKFIEAETINGENIQRYEIQFIGDLDKLIGLIENKYSVENINGNTLYIRTQNYLLKITNCDFNLLDEIQKYLSENNLDFNIESYENKNVSIKIFAVNNPFDLVKRIKNKFSLIVESYNSTVAEFKNTSKGE